MKHTSNDLSPRMVAVLRALDREGNRMTPNEIGYAVGFRRGQDGSKTTRQGRVMGPAQRVISALRGLQKRGYVTWMPRRDGLSGTAYRITDEGRVALRDSSR